MCGAIVAGESENGFLSPVSPDGVEPCRIFFPARAAGVTVGAAREEDGGAADVGYEGEKARVLVSKSTLGLSVVK